MEIELKITDEEDSNNNRRGSAFDGHVRMEDINKVKRTLRSPIPELAARKSGSGRPGPNPTLVEIDNRRIFRCFLSAGIINLILESRTP